MVARLLTAVFAFGDPTYDRCATFWSVNTSGTGTAVVEDFGGLFTRYAMHLQSGAAGYCNLRHSALQPTAKDAYISFAIRLTSYPAETIPIFTLDNSSGTDVYVYLNSDGSIALYAGSLLGTSYTPLDLGKTYFIELKTTSSNLACRYYGPSDAPITFADSATGVQMNGTLQWGPGANYSGLDMHVGNIAVNDTTGSYQTGYPGARRTFVVLPAGAGTTNTWKDTGGGAGSSSNYTLVDDGPPDTSDYIQRPASTSCSDYYTMGGYAALGLQSTENLNLIGISAYHQGSTGALGESGQVKATSGGTASTGSQPTVIPSTGWGTNMASVSYPQMINTVYVNPTDNSAWVASLLDTAQFGPVKSATNTYTFKIAAVWAIVEAQALYSTGAPLMAQGALSMSAWARPGYEYHETVDLNSTQYTTIGSAVYPLLQGTATTAANSEITAASEQWFYQAADTTMAGSSDLDITGTRYHYHPATVDLDASHDMDIARWRAHLGGATVHGTADTDLTEVHYYYRAATVTIHNTYDMDIARYAGRKSLPTLAGHAAATFTSARYLYRAGITTLAGRAALANAAWKGSGRTVTLASRAPIAYRPMRTAEATSTLSMLGRTSGGITGGIQHAGITIPLLGGLGTATHAHATRHTAATLTHSATITALVGGFQDSTATIGATLTMSNAARKTQHTTGTIQHTAALAATRRGIAHLPAALIGAALLAGTSTKSKRGITQLGGASALTNAATRTAKTTTLAAGAAALTGARRYQRNATAVLGMYGDVGNAHGNAHGYTAAAALLGLTSTARRWQGSLAQLVALAGAALTATATHPNSPSAAAVGSLAPLAVKSSHTTATISQTAATTATGGLARRAGATIAAVGNLTAGPAGGTASPAVVGSSANLTANPNRVRPATTTMANTAGLTVESQRSAPIAASADQVAGITAIGRYQQDGAAPLAGQQALSGAPRFGLQSPAPLGQTAALSVAAIRAGVTPVALAADATLGVAAGLARTVDASVAGQALLATAGDRQQHLGLALGAEAGLVETRLPRPVAADFQGTLSCEARRETHATAGLDGVAGDGSAEEQVSGNPLELTQLSALTFTSIDELASVLDTIFGMVIHPGLVGTPSFDLIGELVGEVTSAAADTLWLPSTASLGVEPTTRSASATATLQSLAVLGGESLDVSTYPQEEVDIRCYITVDGVEHDVSCYLRTKEGVERQLWRTGVSDTTDSGECRFTLASDAALFNFRNIRSPYWSPNGWKGAPIRITVWGKPFFTGRVFTVATRYDPDRTEYADFVVRGPLYGALATGTIPDPIRSVIAEAGPALWWPLSDQPGVERLEDATGRGREMRITGKIRGRVPAAAEAHLAQVEGPCGASYIDLSVDENATDTSTGEPVAKFNHDQDEKDRFFASLNQPPAAWYEDPSDPIPWFAGTMVIEMGIKFIDGRADRDVTTYPLVDPDIYSDLDTWGAESVQVHRGILHVDTNIQNDGSLVAVTMAGSKIVTIGIEETPNMAFDAVGSRRKCTWGGYADWSFTIRFGDLALPGHVATLRKAITSQEQGTMFDNSWHHLRLVLNSAGSGAEWAMLWVDGSRQWLYNDYRSGVMPLNRPVAAHLRTIDGTRCDLKQIGVAHLCIANSPEYAPPVARAFHGNSGERATERFRRLLLATGLTPVVTDAKSVPMGPQGGEDLASDLAAIEIADIGQVCELPDGRVRYVTPEDRYAIAGPQLDISDLIASNPPPELSGPSDGVVSTFSATRPAVGAEAPETITTYGFDSGSPGSGEACVASPARLASWAGAKAVDLRPDEDELITATLDLAALPQAIQSWLYATSNPPFMVALGGLPELDRPTKAFIVGSTDTIGPLGWTAALIMRPATAWQVGWHDSGPRVLTGESGALLASTPTDSTLSTYSPQQPRITEDPTSYPIDIECRGERITIIEPITPWHGVVGAGAAVSAGGSATMVAPYSGSEAAGDTLLCALALAAGMELTTPPGWSHLGLAESETGPAVHLLGKTWNGETSVTLAVNATLPAAAQVVTLRGSTPAALAVDTRAGGPLTRIPCPSGDWGPLIGDSITLFIGARTNTPTAITVPAGATKIGTMIDPTGAGLAFGFASYEGPLGLERRNAFFDCPDDSGRGAAIAIAIPLGVQSFRVTRAVNGYQAELLAGDSIQLYDYTNTGL